VTALRAETTDPALTAQMQIAAKTQEAHAIFALNQLISADAKESANEQEQAVRKAEQAKLEAIRNGAAQAEALMRHAQTAGHYAAMVKGGTSSDQSGENKQALATTQSSMQKELSALDAYINAADTSDKARAEAVKERISVETNGYEKIIQLVQQIQQEEQKSGGVMQEAFVNSFQALGGQVDSFADSLMKAAINPQKEMIRRGFTEIHVNLRGQEMANAARKLFMQMANDFVNSVLNGLSQLAAKNLAPMLFKQGTQMTSGSGLGGMLSQLIAGGMPTAASLLGGSAAPVAGAIPQAANIAGTGLSTGGALNSAFSSAGSAGAGAGAIGSSLKSAIMPVEQAIQSQTKDMGSKILTSSAEIIANNTEQTGLMMANDDMIGAEEEVGLAATALKPMVLGFSLAGGGVLPSAAGGMIASGPMAGGIPSILHPQEMVLPKPLSLGIQNMIKSHGTEGAGRGGGNMAHVNYSPTINTGKTQMSSAEFGQMLSSHSASMAGEARNMIRRGWRP
jgi:hypothetical protein